MNKSLMQDINTKKRKIMTKRSADETVYARKISCASCRYGSLQVLEQANTALSGVKSQREIAAEVGYDRPNIISMMKSGRHGAAARQGAGVRQGAARRSGAPLPPGAGAAAAGSRQDHAPEISARRVSTMSSRSFRRSAKRPKTPIPNRSPDSSIEDAFKERRHE